MLPADSGRQPRLVVWRPEQSQVPDLRALDCQTISVVSRDTIAEAIAQADVVLVTDFHARDADDVWRDAQSLQWVHVLSTGVDHVLTPALINSSALITNGRGCFNRPTAEFVLMMILSLAKDLRKSLRAQDHQQWESHESERIDVAHALVIGPGAIGSEVAAVIAGVGMTVDGIGRHLRPASGGFRAIHSVRDLKTLIGQYDYIILSAPLTSENRKMIDADVLHAMRRTARLINVGRGELVDEQALTEALTHGTIAGAALDVFAVEPLPSTSALWTLPNVIITGHMAGDFAGWRQKEFELFTQNFQRFVSRRPLLNVVDKSLGYVPSESRSR